VWLMTELLTRVAHDGAFYSCGSLFLFVLLGACKGANSWVVNSSAVAGIETRGVVAAGAS
jgi:hypothetical protein